MKLYDVILVKFPKTQTKEFSGFHYAIVVAINTDGTVVVIPLINKKKGKKYTNGITILNSKYQQNSTCHKCFACILKIRQIDVCRIYNHQKVIFTLDEEDSKKLKLSMKQVFKL